MNRIHDHTKATPSNEADRIEEEIELIQDDLGSLIRQFISSVRQMITPKLLKDKRVLLALAGLYFYCALKSALAGRAKKRRKPARSSCCCR